MSLARATLPRPHIRNKNCACMAEVFGGLDGEDFVDGDEAISFVGGRRVSRATMWKSFSCADWHRERMEAAGATEWRKWKDEGNARFAEKDYSGAHALYAKAGLLALGPFRNGAVDAFNQTLKNWPVWAASRRFVDVDVLVQQVLHFLPPVISKTFDGKTYHAPNTAAAVCAANSSAAWLLEGRPREALAAARDACEADPGYLKGHRRELAALLRLRRDQIKAMRVLRRGAPGLKLEQDALERCDTAVREKQEDLRDWETAQRAYPTEDLALLTAGFTDYERATFIYGPIRFRACLQWLRGGPLKCYTRCEARASLVPFQKGQVLMLSLCYAEWPPPNRRHERLRQTLDRRYGAAALAGLDALEAHEPAEGGFYRRWLAAPRDNVIQCLDWIMLDPENGDLADAPPMGIASENSLKYGPARINMFIEELHQYGLEVVSVMLGQGLTEHVDRVDRTLREGCDIAPKTYKDVLVYHAASTAASEDNGILANPDPRAVHALRRRQPPAGQDFDSNAAALMPRGFRPPPEPWDRGHRPLARHPVSPFRFAASTTTSDIVFPDIVKLIS